MRIVNGLPGAEEMLSRLRYHAALVRVWATTAAILLTIAWMTPASAIERIANDSGGQIGTHLTIQRAAQDWSTGRNRWHLRLGMHACGWLDPPQPHLRDTACRVGLPCRLGSYALWRAAQ